MKTWYVYIHRKATNREIFYVGIGSQSDYKRAFEKRKRNDLWKNIVSKYGYTIEIVGDFLTKDQAVLLEKGVIKTLGRRDISTGILSNMTIGGDGVIGFPISQEHREKLSKSLRGKNCYWYGKKLSKDHKAKISLSNTGNVVGLRHKHTKIILDLLTGVFYYGAKDASNILGIKYSTLKSMLNGTNRNKTSLVYV